MKTRILAVLTLLLLAAPVMAQEGKNMKTIGEKLLAKATKGAQLLQICEMRQRLQEQTFPPHNKPSGSIRIYVYSKTGGTSLEFNASDEGFEQLNVALENAVRELGAKLVEKE